MNHSDDLDQLLDSALDDFQTLDLASSAHSNDGVKKAEGSYGLGLGLGLGLPPSKKGSGKQQKKSHVSETLNKLRKQTRETVKGLESIAGDGFAYDFDDSMLEDWVKQFEELTGSQEMESMMDAMMQQLMSKQVLHEHMKEIEEKYPKWLQDNESNLNKNEYDRYFHQHQLIKDLNTVYESEPSTCDKIAELMQQCGQPPNDIVKELDPDFDISTLGHLSPAMLDSQGNCCIM